MWNVVIEKDTGEPAEKCIEQQQMERLIREFFIHLAVILDSPWIRHRRLALPGVRSCYRRIAGTKAQIGRRDR
jgi:hypothetical protein